MSETTVVQGPTVKPSDKTNGRIPAIFLQPKLMPLSPMDTIAAVVQRTEDKPIRDMTDNETGAKRDLPGESYVYIAGDIKLIVRGGTAKREGKLPPEGDYVLLQIHTVANKFGTKFYLDKWRKVSDILSASTGQSVGSPLKYPAQMVSDVEGYDFDVREPEPMKLKFEQEA